MRIVAFTRATGTDLKLYLDAEKCIAVAQCYGEKTLTEIHLEGGFTFMVKEAMEPVMETIWPYLIRPPEGDS